jgi:hypothetical protein
MPYTGEVECPYEEGEKRQVEEGICELACKCVIKCPCTFKSIEELAPTEIPR